MNLRNYAKGKTCQIRLPGCTDGPACLAHLRTADTGYGQKENDLLGAWACQNCHDIVDGRKNLPPAYLECFDVKQAFYDGIIRTQKKLVEEKIVKW